MKKEDYTTGHLFDYRYIEENYVLIAKGLSKQHTVDSDPKFLEI